MPEDSREAVDEWETDDERQRTSSKATRPPADKAEEKMLRTRGLS